MLRCNHQVPLSQKGFSPHKATLEFLVFESFDFYILCSPAETDRFHSLRFLCIPALVASDRSLGLNKQIRQIVGLKSKVWLTSRLRGVELENRRVFVTERSDRGLAG